MSESGITFFNPSVVQKRFEAKGRSEETTRTTVFSSPPAFSLNFRVEVAQTEVSRLGTMLSTFFLPWNVASEVFLRSPSTSLKSGAFEPTGGRSPIVWMGVPLSVTVAMSSSLDGGGRGGWERACRRACWAGFVRPRHPNGVRARAGVPERHSPLSVLDARAGHQGRKREGGSFAVEARTHRGTVQLGYRSPSLMTSRKVQDLWVTMARR